MVQRRPLVIIAGAKKELPAGDTLPVTKADVGLGNADNTSDLNKPVSTATQTALNLKQSTSEKGVANGYASLDGTGKVPAAQLPSYVDDVLEYANLAAFPGAGVAGIIYIAADTNRTYRWTGTVYAEISPSPGSTDGVAEGASNLYFTYQRVRDTVLTGLSTATNAVITAADSVLTALGKLQKQISDNLTALTNHTGNTGNPHATTAAQVGAPTTTGGGASGNWAINAATATRAVRAADETGGLRLVNPAGASRVTTNATETGAIKISLPTTGYGISPMIRMTVRIYEYSGGDASPSRTIELGGYFYSVNSSWINRFATQQTDSGGDINVRFGHDGTRPCVWIGELATVWAYPQVFVTDVQVGYLATAYANWGEGWSIGVVTAFDSVFGAAVPALKNNVVAGAGLTKTGSQLDVVGTAGRIVANADSIDLAALADGGVGTFLKITRDAYGRVSGTQAAALADLTGLGAAPLASPALTGVPTAPNADTSVATSQLATAAYVKRLFGANSTAGTLDWNDVSNTRPGGGPTLLAGSAANGPDGTGNYYHALNIEYGGAKDGAGNVTQFAIPYSSPAPTVMWMRGRYSGVWTAWVRFVTNSNLLSTLGYTPENAANKGVANGYAGLDAGGKVPAAQLPSYVDDVLEYANLAAFPGTGEAAKIYVALDTNKTYRWSGSAYVEISPSPGSTDSVIEGILNLYFTYQRVRDTLLTGLSFAVNAPITAALSVLEALGRLQAQITAHFGVGGSTHPAATTSVAGFMSAADKTKLDGVSPGAGITTRTRLYLPSGTYADFTGIPAGVKQITVTLHGVSLNANDNLILQIGDSGGIETTGYTSLALSMDYINTAFTTGFGLTGSNDASLALTTVAHLVLMDETDHSWVMSSTGHFTNAFQLGSGAKWLSGTLDRIRLTTVGGTANFDGGYFGLSYQ